MLYIRGLNITKPLFFLCGPYIKTGDKNKKRRIIMANYLSTLKIKLDDEEYFRPLPIIVDVLFSNNDEIKEYDINITLLEEIVANISSHTYIFLDTISTSYELGLFANTKQKNDVKIFIENRDKERTNCVIGNYIYFSQENNIKKYNAYIDPKNDYIYFKNDEIPKELSTICDDDFKSEASNMEVLLQFVEQKNDYKEKFGEIHYSFDENNIYFNLDIKTIFYFLGTFISKYITSKKDFPSEEIKKIIMELKKEIFISFYYLTDNKTTIIKKIFKDNFNIYIQNKNYESIEELIKNICYVIYAMKRYDEENEYNSKIIKSPFSQRKIIHYETDKIDEYDFFGLNDKDKIIIEDYDGKNDYYIKKFKMQMKKKVRNIITYANNHKGEQLKELHKKLDNNLRYLFPSTKYSFAYKKDSNTLKCINEHLNSNVFYKYDIHHFFESITQERLINIIYSYQKEKLTDFLNLYEISDYYISDLLNINKGQLRKIIHSLKFNNKFPIGFITSPILSDIFMFDFDMNIFDEIKKSIVNYKIDINDIHYTRYADDILISSTKNINISSYLISNCLEKKGLILNNMKTRNCELKNNGDFIKFLGIVIIRKNGKNEIKISNSYLRKVYKEIIIYKSKLFKGIKLYSFHEQILGKLRYINFISPDSFEKLKEICFKKLKINLNNFKKMI